MKVIEIKTVSHNERPTSLEVEITGIPQWKQDVYNLVAELTKYRLRSKITQKELAERLKVSQSVIARFEKLGRYPTIEFLYKVAAGLGMQIEISTRVMPDNPDQDTKAALFDSETHPRKIPHGFV